MAWHPGSVNGGWVGPVDTSVPGAGPGLQTRLRLGESVAAQSHSAGSEEHGLQWSHVALEWGVENASLSHGPPGGPKGQAYHLSLHLTA